MRRERGGQEMSRRLRVNFDMDGSGNVRSVF